MPTNKYFACPFCRERFTREDLVTHIDRKHYDELPEGFTPLRATFHAVNRKDFKYNRPCRICKKPTPWNENKGRYDFLCGNQACKTAWINNMKDTMGEKYGAYRPTTSAEGLEKMLAGRKISGTYKFSTGGEVPYTGSYEKKCLEFMDKVMGIKFEDLEVPGPAIKYPYKGSDHIYIPDIYYKPYNLLIEVKDGGSNPNTHPGYSEVRAKKIAKENYVIKHTDYNYLRLTDNDFSQLFGVFADLKMHLNNDDKSRVIHVHESGLYEHMGIASMNPIVGFIPGKDAVIVNNPSRQTFGVADSPRFEKVVTLDAKNHLGLHDKQDFGKEVDIKTYIKKDKYKDIAKELEKFMDNDEELSESAFYEILFGHPMYTKDQILFEDVIDYDKYMASINNMVIESTIASLFGDAEDPDYFCEGFDEFKSTFLNEEDVKYNYDAFSTGNSDILFISGPESFGRAADFTNIAQQFGADIIHLDDVQQHYRYSDKTLKHKHDLIYKYFCDTPEGVEERKKKKKDIEVNLYETVPRFLTFFLANKEPNKRYIVEGHQLLDLLAANRIDFNVLKPYSVLLKGSSYLQTQIQTMKSDSNTDTEEDAFKLMKNYIDAISSRVKDITHDNFSKSLKKKEAIADKDISDIIDDAMTEASLPQFTINKKPLPKGPVTLYHGSCNGSYDTILANSPNNGKRWDKISQVSFWFINKEYATMFATGELLNKETNSKIYILIDNDMKTLVPEKYKDEAEKILKSKKSYVYIKTVDSKYVSNGQGRNFPEYTLSFNVKPDEVYTNTYEDMRKSIKYVSDEYMESIIQKYKDNTMTYGNSLLGQILDKIQYDTHQDLINAKKVIKNYNKTPVIEACKDLKTARQFASEVKDLASKYDANFYLVTDGASATNNDGTNDAVRHAREIMKQWETERGFDAKEDWSKSVNESAEVIEPLIKSPEDLLHWMKKNLHYSNFSKLKTWQVVLESKSGSCHDFVMFEKHFFDKFSHSLGVKYSTLFCMEFKDGENTGGRTHSFLYFWDTEDKFGKPLSDSTPKKYYWFEVAWDSQSGIRGPYNSIGELKNDIEKKMLSESKLDFVEFSTFKGLPGMSLQELVEACMDGPLDESQDVSKLDKDHVTKKGYTFKYIDLNSPEAEKYLKDNVNIKKIKTKRTELAVCKETNEVAGYIYINKDNGVIGPLKVFKNYRGYGVGDKLFEDGVKKFGGKELGVFKDNEIAIKIYKSHGFKVSEDHDNYVKMIKESYLKEDNEGSPVISKPYFITAKDGSTNACVKIDGYDKPFRGRSSMLILRFKDGDWEVFLSKDNEKNHEYHAPGGGWNQGEDPKDAAIREAQEECYMNVDNVKRMGFLMEVHDKVADWVKENVSDPKDWWYNYYSEIFVGTYESKYNGEVRDEDKDQIANSGKWYNFKEIKEDLTPKEYAEAIENYINDMDDTVSEFSSNDDLFDDTFIPIDEMEEGVFYCIEDDTIDLTGDIPFLEVTDEDLEKNKSLSPVFVMLSYNGSAVGTVIRDFGKELGWQYSHSSISLVSNLSTLYSFNITTSTDDEGVKHKYNGLAIEHFRDYRDNPKCKIKVIAILVDKDTKEKIRKAIQYYIDNINKTKYAAGSLGKALLGTGGNVKNFGNMTLFCSQFVDTVLKQANIDIAGKGSSINVHPSELGEFKDRNNYFTVYEGLASGYNVEQIDQKINYMKSTMDYKDLNAITDRTSTTPLKTTGVENRLKGFIGRKIAKVKEKTNHKTEPLHGAVAAEGGA